MSVKPTRPSTKLIAGILVVCVGLIAMLIVITFNRNPSYDPTPSYDTSVCWNVVIDGDFWPNGCKGTKEKDLICTQALIELTAQEKAEYKEWVMVGKPDIPDCQ